MTQSSTFAESWERSCGERAASTFLVFDTSDGTVTQWTYGEFDAVVDAAVSLLTSRGAGRGSAVHVALANSPAFVAVWLAATRLGAWIVPSDPMATAPELAEHLRRVGPSIGFCATSRRRTYEAGVREAGLDAGFDAGIEVVDVDETGDPLAWLCSAATPAPHAQRPDPGDRAAVMFTSGTTGRPKGVEITQANYAFAGSVMAAAAGLTPEDRQLVVLPMFHANAQYYSFAAAIAVGASVALMSTFSASGFLAAAARHGATHASLFAGPLRMILARGGPLLDASALRLSHCWFAQNLTADQYETISEWFGCRPRQLYGMTETIPAVLTDRPDAAGPDTMGYVTDGCEVDLHDEAGRSCAPGEVGEIVVGGTPGRTLFAGYLDDPVTTAASFCDGWFRTGDRATRDAEGRFRFCGRRSDTLKVAGENVSVVEVEEVLAAHPDVLEAAVVGAPDPVRDEVPVAFVVAKPGIGTDELPGSLGAWCEQRLAKAKRPNRYQVVDALPRTSVGKIRTFLLRQDVERMAGSQGRPGSQGGGAR